MGLPKLQTCCFIFDLKTGCIIMGSINAVLSFTMLCILIVFATALGVLADNVTDDVEEQATATGLYAMCIILVIMFVVKFIFDVMFLWAVSQERANIIKIYMIMWIVFFLLHMFIFFLNIPHFEGGAIGTEIFYIGHNIYTILITRSFYKQLNNREEV